MFVVDGDGGDGDGGVVFIGQNSFLTAFTWRIELCAPRIWTQ